MDADDRERLKTVVNRAFWVVIQNKTQADNWGVYLFNSDFDDERELRNKITAIYLAGILDTMAPGIAQHVATARFTAQFNGYQSLLAWCDRVKEFVDVTGALLSRYSYEELLFVHFQRNRLVHGWLGGEVQEHMNVRWYDATNKSIAEKTLSRRDRSRAIAPFLEAGLDNALAPLRDRLLEKQPYWRAIDHLKSPGYIEEPLKMVYADTGFEWDPTVGFR